MGTMISLQNLSISYRNFAVIDNISFTCSPGRITGFLGPNGSGKSTTMRGLLGLTPIDSGTATVNGVPYTSLPNPGRVVGVSLDASAQHPGRTGHMALSLAAATIGVERSRVDAVLAQVGLTHVEARRQIKKYSLGMRQRLALAIALIGSPQMLVLDEPANGLDPSGIYWMRNLLRDFADAGGTVLLSSHLLHEVEQIADDMVIIGGGRVIASGPTAELAAEHRNLEALYMSLTEGTDRDTISH